MRPVVLALAGAACTCILHCSMLDSFMIALETMVFPSMAKCLTLNITRFRWQSSQHQLTKVESEKIIKLPPHLKCETLILCNKLVLPDRRDLHIMRIRMHFVRFSGSPIDGDDTVASFHKTELLRRSNSFRSKNAHEGRFGSRI